jgi:hypothetical protein
MVVITQELWLSILEKLESGQEKASIMESLLNDGFSVLEADAILEKAQLEFEKQKQEKIRQKPPGFSLRAWFRQPPQIITLLAILVGILLPLSYYALLHIPFSFFWGFAWILYILGTWIACLSTGNIPAMFGRESDIMIAQCKTFGSNSSGAQSAVHLGGFFFSLILGSLLVIYMVYLARKFYNDKNSSPDIRRMKYFAAWFNGTLGFTSLNAMTYLLFSGYSGQMLIDMSKTSQLLSISPEILGKILVAVVLSIWTITGIIVISMLVRVKKPE